MRDLSIYIHIPFCVRKCRYCDFLSYPAAEWEQESYFEALLSEIEKQSFFYRQHRVISVFIGGGTPSILSQNKVEILLEKLKQNYIFLESPENTEITIEINPGTVTEEKISAYLRAGINRLSIGLQSTDDEELRLLGRIHKYSDFCRTYEMARQAGFHNINIDLMSAIPGQTKASYQKTLERVLAFKPEHISAYSLILEEGTWFYEHKEQLSFPGEEEDRELYAMTEEMLASFGYNRYEISNYAREGFECVHNKVYWQRGDYVGFGLGAASMVEEVRWNNRRNVSQYIAGIYSGCKQPPACYVLSHSRTRFGENIQYLTGKEQMEEFMFLGLRLMKGIEKKAFYRKFGVTVESIYQETLEKLERDGLLVIDDFIRLTPYGIDISNYVMAQFLY